MHLIKMANFKHQKTRFSVFFCCEEQNLCMGLHFATRSVIVGIVITKAILLKVLLLRWNTIERAGLLSLTDFITTVYKTIPTYLYVT